MKNAGKACNNRLYRHIRTFEKIVKNYFVIYSEKDKKKYKVHRMSCVQKKRVFLPGYRRSVTRNWRSAYEGSSRLRSNEVPGGDFKR